MTLQRDPGAVVCWDRTVLQKVGRDSLHGIPEEEVAVGIGGLSLRIEFPEVDDLVDGHLDALEDGRSAAFEVSCYGAEVLDS